MELGRAFSQYSVEFDYVWFKTPGEYRRYEILKGYLTLDFSIYPFITMIGT